MRRSILDDADDSLRRRSGANGSSAAAGPAPNRATAADASDRLAACSNVSSRAASATVGTMSDSYDDGMRDRALADVDSSGLVDQGSDSWVTRGHVMFSRFPTIYPNDGESPNAFFVAVMTLKCNESAPTLQM